MKTLATFILAIAAPLIMLAQEPQPEKSRFIRTKLPGGVTLDVPKGWNYAGPDQKRIMETYAESLWDLTGVPFGRVGTLLMAKPPQNLGYMCVTVALEYRQTATQQQLQQIPKTQLAELDQQNRKDLEAESPYNGLKIQSWGGTTIEKVGNSYAMIKRYSYTLPNGPVRRLENCQFFLGDKIVSIMFEDTDGTIIPAKPIFERIKTSIDFR